MRVGIFGGTFDPVHNGHLRVAEEVRESYGLEKVYFVPAYVQPLKRDMKVTDASDRIKMIRAATRGNPFLGVSDVEITRGGVSYSIETVKVFAKKFEEVYFLIGIDAFSELRLWHGYREIFSYTHFVVMVRPNYGKAKGPDIFPADIKGEIRQSNESTFDHASGKKIYFHSITQLDISSTKIRELSRTNRSIKYLVPYAVERFITQGGLYTS